MKKIWNSNLIPIFKFFISFFQDTNAKPRIVIIAGILSYGSKKKIIPTMHKFIIQPPPVGTGFKWLLLTFGISRIFFFLRNFLNILYQPK